MTGFTVVALGQFLSILGTNMTLVALTIWAWTVTGSATALAALGFFLAGPTIVFSPMAGALVDRWNRKLVMMLADMAAGVATAALLVLYLMGLLQIWHLYMAAAFAGVFQAFQFPAYTAAVALMIPKDQYGRASGMMSLAQSVGGIFAPIAAGALIGTLALALGALLLVHVPQPARRRPATGRAAAEDPAGDTGTVTGEDDGSGNWRRRRVGQLLAGGGLRLPLRPQPAEPVRPPTGLHHRQPPWRPQRGSGLADDSGPHGERRPGPGNRPVGCRRGRRGRRPADVHLGRPAAQDSRGPAGLGGVVPPGSARHGVLGQRHSIRALIAQVASPLAMLVAGPLADYWLEPGMRPGGPLARAFGDTIGTGPGTGMALMFIFSGIVGTLVIAAAYSIRIIRDVEDLIPDFDGASAGGDRPPGSEETVRAGEPEEAVPAEIPAVAPSDVTPGPG